MSTYYYFSRVYVDDIIFGYIDETLSTELADVMAKKFEMSMTNELRFFIGLQFKKFVDGIFNFQAKYITDLLKKFGFTNCKPSKTPMSPFETITVNPYGNDGNAKIYRGMIGSLLYLTSSHLDIML